MHVRPLPAVVLLSVLAGCLAPAALESASLPVDGLLGEVRLLDEGGFEMEVPVHVYLLGFDPAVAEALQAKLPPTPIDHAAGSFLRTFPPDPADPQAPLAFKSWRAPTQPIADFRVHDLSAGFDALFLEAAKGWAVPEADGQYDANAAEAWLAANLPSEGVVLDRANPVFVVLHAGDALGEHGWRHTFSHGHIDDVRIFGEREPLTVFDVSAAEDPYVVSDPSSPMGVVFSTVFGPSPDHAYNHPVAREGEATVDVLAELAVHAAHYRFLKGPIYPISTRPCHHVTLVYAVHTTALTETLPGYTRAEDWVDAPRLEGYFENATGDEVTVDLVSLRLPQDDPVLDALTRGAGSFATLDALRWYLDENFETYVTLQDGCEEYLSLLVFGDPATVGAFGGIGTYDVERSHRISFSLVSDTARLRSDPNAPDAIRAENPSRRFDLVNLLYAHETGHLLGLHHPQHLSDTAGELPANSAFEGVYSVMSYQQYDRNSDFGAVDYATWIRGRVGYTIRDAQALDLVGTPEFDAAIAGLRAGDWTGAHLALEDALGHGAHEHPERLPDFEFVGRHPHPWG